MKLIATGLLSICLTAASLAQEVKPLPVEELGSPVTTMEYSDFTACGPTGEAHHLMFFHPMRNPMECQARVVDLASGKVVEAAGPQDRPLRMIEKDGRFYLGNYGSCGLWVYDPAAMKLEYKAGPDLGRCVMFQMIVGGDGAIYMGTTSGCEVIRYDPATGQFRNYGRQGPKVAGPRYVYSIGAEGDYIYSAAGKNPWHLVALHIKSGEQKVLMSDMEYLSVSGSGAFASATAKYKDKDGNEFQRQFVLKGGEMFENAQAAGGPDGRCWIFSRDSAELTVIEPDGARKSYSLKDLPPASLAFHLLAAGPGRLALAADAQLIVIDAADGARTAIPTAGKAGALAWTPEGTLLVGAQDLHALPARANTLGLAAKTPGAVTDILVEDEFAYLATAKGGCIVNLRDGAVTPFNGGGRMSRIYGKIYSSEAGVQRAMGNSVFVPARIRLEKGQAIPDLTYQNYDLWHHYFAGPDVALDAFQPDGSTTFSWKMRNADEWRSTPMKIKPLPVKIEALYVLPDGRIWGNSKRYQETFLFNPADGAFTVMGKFLLSGPKMHTIGGKVYMTGYPGVGLLEYDPAKPWTMLWSKPGQLAPDPASPDSNPRLLRQLGDPDKAPAHFPRATAMGADGVLYVGAHCERSAVGGALIWWNPKDGAVDALREPFLVQDCAGLAAAYDGRKIVYSSMPVSDPTGKLAKPPEAKLYVIDTATRKLEAEYVPAPGAASAGDILARGAKVFGFVAGAKPAMYVFDLDQGKVIGETALAGAPYGPVWGPDGAIYVFIGDTLNRVDADAAKLTPLGAVDVAGPMVFRGNDLYIGGRPPLRRVRDITALK